MASANTSPPVIDDPQPPSPDAPVVPAEADVRYVMLSDDNPDRWPMGHEFVPPEGCDIDRLLRLGVIVAME